MDENMNNNTAKTIQQLNNENFQRLLGPTIFLIIMLIVGIPGNLTVLIIYGRKYTKSVYRTIVWNLAIADQIFCTVGIPFNIARVVHYYSFQGEWACVVFVVMLYLLLLYSTHLLMLLSIHRFRKICMPLKSQLTVRNVNYWVVACLGISVVLSSPQFALSKFRRIDIGQNLTGTTCAISLSNPSIYHTVFSYGFLSLFVLYTLVLIFIYSMIGRQMYIQTHRRKEMNGNGIPSSISSKMTKIAFAISLVFALSYIPVFVLQTTRKMIAEEELSAGAFSIVKIAERLYVVNHVVNPFIYGVFDNQFKQHLKELVTFNCPIWSSRQSTKSTTPSLRKSTTTGSTSTSSMDTCESSVNEIGVKC